MWKYILVYEDYSLAGTNDEAVAKEAAEYTLVIDVEKKIEMAGSHGKDIPIPEVNEENR